MYLKVLKNYKNYKNIFFLEISLFGKYLKGE